MSPARACTPILPFSKFTSVKSPIGGEWGSDKSIYYVRLLVTDVLRMDTASDISVRDNYYIEAPALTTS
jgi:hypothetical protein